MYVLQTHSYKFSRHMHNNFSNSHSGGPSHLTFLTWDLWETISFLSKQSNLGRDSCHALSVLLAVPPGPAPTSFLSQCRPANQPVAKLNSFMCACLDIGGEKSLLMEGSTADIQANTFPDRADKTCICIPYASGPCHIYFVSS